MQAAANTADVYRHILDSMPTPIFVVDRDMKVLDHNVAAHELLAVPLDSAQGHRGGHILQCLNAVALPEGCGQTPFCPKCGLRNALNSAVRGERRVHTRATLKLVHHGEEEERTFHITVAPFEHDGESRWLLVMEDRTEQVELENLFPLCSSCHEPRSDEALRKRAEVYLRKQWAGNPTACLCANCRARLLGASPDA
jgi:PAS domain-containing protein